MLKRELWVRAKEKKKHQGGGEGGGEGGWEGGREGAGGVGGVAKFCLQPLLHKSPTIKQQQQQNQHKQTTHKSSFHNSR